MEVDYQYQIPSGKDVTVLHGSLVKTETNEELTIIDVSHEDEHGHQMKEEDPVETSWPEFSFVKVEEEDQICEEVQDDVSNLWKSSVESSVSLEEEASVPQLEDQDVKYGDKMDSTLVACNINPENSASPCIEWTKVDFKEEKCINKEISLSVSEITSDCAEIIRGGSSSGECFVGEVKSDTKSLCPEAKQIACGLCSISFSNQIELDKHIELTHSKPKAYTCDTCNKSFSWRYDLVFHQITHTGFKPLKCNICKECSCKDQKHRFRRKKYSIMSKNGSKSVNQFSKYIKDNSSSSKVNSATVIPLWRKRTKYLSFGNQTDFSTTKKYRQICQGVTDTVKSCALITKNTETEKNCALITKENFCSQEFLAVPVQSLGMQQTYSGTVLLPVKNQTDCFRTVNNQHISKNSSEARTTCPAITQSNSCSHDLTDVPAKLMETCQGIKQYECDVCKVIFSHETDLTNHSVLHSNGKLYTCDICDKAFPRKYDLVFHQIIHTGLKPVKGDIREQQVDHKFRCDFCYKFYTSQGHLSRHQCGQHSIKKPYQCHLCSKSGINEKSISSHRCSHSEAKLFQCNICDTSYKSKQNYIQHILLMHS